MSTLAASPALLLVVVWPLLLVAGMASGVTRSLALRLVPWAALPALVTAAIAASGLQLPGGMLGSALVLDPVGRVFLLLNAILFLATGLLTRPRLKTAGAERFAVLLSLVMTGSFCLALAGDALLFFTAATLAGYALYGLLMIDADVVMKKAGRVLVMLLVVSDLLVFELLLMLGHAAGSVDFASMRKAFPGSGSEELMLGLLIVGFGIKAGIAGFHLWIAPVLINAVAVLRPALISFIFSAGLLGWLRMLPLGETLWPEAGIVLLWLGSATLVYVVLASLSKAGYRALLANIIIALTGFWLAVSGSALQYPQGWNEVAEAVYAAVLQSGFALTALLLLERGATRDNHPWLLNIAYIARWLAAVSLVIAPLCVTSSLVEVGAPGIFQMYWIAVAIAFLVCRALFLYSAALHDPCALRISTQVVQQDLEQQLHDNPLIASALAIAAMLVAAYSLSGLLFAGLWQFVWIIIFAGVVAWLSLKLKILQVPFVVAGNLMNRISDDLACLLAYSRGLLDRQSLRLREARMDLVARFWSDLDFSMVVERFDIGIRRWRTVLMILLLLGIMVAILGGN